METETRNRLARALSDRLEATIGKENLRAAILANRSPQNFGECHTQDYCDTNELLIQVMHADNPLLPSAWEKTHFADAEHVYNHAFDMEFFREITQ